MNKKSLGSGESDRLSNLPLDMCIRFCNPPNYDGPIKITILKQRKKGDKLVINNEQQTIFGAFRSE